MQELEQKVEHWMEKYDKDVEQKQHELDVLKASKAKDLERLQELTKLVNNIFCSKLPLIWSYLLNYWTFVFCFFEKILHAPIEDRHAIH